MTIPKPTVAIYFPFSEINNDVPSTLEQFRERLAGFKRGNVLHLCSLMNALLRDEKKPINEKGHDELVRHFFPRQLADRFLTRVEGEAVRFVFHRQQILFVAKEACAICKDEGINPTAAENGFGEVFLMAGDHLPAHFDMPKELDDKFAAIAAHMTPIQEAAGVEFAHKMVRSYLMLTSAIQSLRDRVPFVDIPAEFEKVTGMKLLTFYSLMLASLTRFMEFNSAAYVANPANYSLSEQWFASTKVPQKTLASFFAYISSTPDQYAEAIRRRDWGPSDFTAFRDKPLFRDNKNLFLMDYAFLAEKFETGPFWTVHWSLDPGKRDLLHSFWGTVFERYLGSVLEETCRAPANSVYLSPIYEDRQNEQVCDAIVVCGDAAAFIEMKGMTFTAKAKYSGSLDDMKTELEKKLVQDDNAPKAVHQLSSAVNNVCTYNTHSQIHNVNLQGVTTIYPVVITRDDIGASLGVNQYLNNRFEPLVNRKLFSKGVTRLLCMSSDNIERISGYLADRRLTDILAAHLAANLTIGKRILNPLFTVPNSVLDSKSGRKPPVHARGWDEVTQLAIDELGIKP